MIWRSLCRVTCLWYAVPLLVLLFFAASSESFGGTYPGPVFNGRIGTVTYTLIESHKDMAYMHDGFWDKVPQKDRISRQFRSTRWLKCCELWDGPQGAITIYHYIFEYPLDALLYPETGHTPICAGFWKTGWSKIPDIGDATCWIQRDIVLFARGRSLVRIYFNSALLSDEEKRCHIRKIAAAIVQKVSSREGSEI